MDVRRLRPDGRFVIKKKRLITRLFQFNIYIFFIVSRAREKEIPFGGRLSETVGVIVVVTIGFAREVGALGIVFSS